MAKRKIYEVDQSERRGMLKDFFSMVAGIKNAKEAENFFKDMLTPSEALMLTRRIEIAKGLLAGQTYAEISKNLRVGTNTVNSVNRWLFAGFGGYLNEIKKSETIKELRRSMPTTEWERIKRKYPAHFLIFNLIDKFKGKNK